MNGDGDIDVEETGENGNGAVRFPWEGETVDFSDAMLARGRAYGSYVNTNRALPDVRDGLKPVQRRIIVAMDDLGFRADRKYAKSAKVCGHVIGTYHPHGDSAVYDAMVRMAQPWQSNLPLIDGQGNWGNLNNEAPAAAQRYTECRLSRAATEFLSDMRPEIVDYEPNYDETAQMPSVLPVTFPNLLVNGSMGVGWAMACSIPPHNTAEAISAALLVLDDPDVSVDKLLKVMPGPDLPGGGIIVNPENLRSIYETGRGTVVVQGRIEQLPGQQVLRITELPYQTSAKSIVEQAVQGAKDGKIGEIFTAELPKNLTDAHGIDIQIKAKRGGSIEKLTHELLQYTRLRDTLAFNFTVLVDGIPQTLPLRDLLRHFVDFRCQVVRRRLEYERLVLRRRLHLLLAERAAVDVIDRVVRIIRNAADDDDSKQQLIATLRYVPHGETRRRPIDELQAQHIIDMPLKKLNALNQFKLDEEIAQKGARIDQITAILDSDEGVRDVVRSELREVKKRYARPRRTILATEFAAATTTNGNGKAKTRMVALAAAPSEEVWAYLGSSGAVLVAARGGREPASSPLKLAGDAALVAAVATRSDQPLLLFTEQGQAYRAPLSDHQITKSGAGRPIVAPRSGDALIGAFAGDAPYYLLVTERGQIKRLPTATLEAAHPGGITCCRVADGDRIVAVVPHGEDDEIVIAKAFGQVLRIETGSKLRPVATAAAGTVAGVKVDPDDRVVSAALATDDFLLSLHESGRALRVRLGEYPVKGRATAGVQSVVTDRPARDPAGPLALITPLSQAAATVVFTDKGSFYEIGPTDAPLARRAANSTPLLPLGPGEQPTGVVSY